MKKNVLFVFSYSLSFYWCFHVNRLMPSLKYYQQIIFINIYFYFPLIFIYLYFCKNFLTNRLGVFLLYPHHEFILAIILCLFDIGDQRFGNSLLKFSLKLFFIELKDSGRNLRSLFLD